MVLIEEQRMKRDEAITLTRQPRGHDLCPALQQTAAEQLLLTCAHQYTIPQLHTQQHSV